MIRLDEQDLWDMADTVLVGRVALPPKPVVEAGSNVIYSKITIFVDEYVVAPPLQKEIRQIEILQPGGTHHGRTMVVPGMPSFRQNERVFLFLRRNPHTGQYGVVGLSQGKFGIRTEEKTGLDYLVPSPAQVNLVPILRGGQRAGVGVASQAGKTAATPREEQTAARRPVRYLNDVIGQIKAYKNLKSGLDR